MAVQETHRYDRVMRHLQTYRAINAIVRHGSIRRAAAALAMSPSALNRQVLAFEEELGAPLFERLKSGVRLSAAGEVYLRCFRDHLAGMEQARSRVGDLVGNRTGVVRVGVAVELATNFLPRLVAAHAADHPGVEFDVVPASFDQGDALLRTYDLDLALAVNPQFGASAESLAVRETAPVGVLRGASARRLGVADLVQRPLIAPRPGSGLRNMLDAAFAARRLPARYAVEKDDFALRLAKDLPGALAIGLPEDLDDAELSAAGLHAAPFTRGLFVPVAIHLLQLRGRVLPVAAENFAKALIRSMA